MLDDINHNVARIANATDIPAAPRVEALNYALNSLTAFKESGISTSRFSFVSRYIFENIAHELYWKLPSDLRFRR